MGSSAEKIRLPSETVRVVGMCFAVCLIEGFDTASLGVVAPALAKALRLPMDQMGIIFSAGMLGMMLGSASGGYLADRQGAKRTMLFSLLILAVSCSLTALAPGFAVLLILRAVAGIGIGAALPCLIVLAEEVAPADRRATLLSIIFLGFPFGSMLAALLSTPLIARLGWSSVFLVGGASPIMIALLVMRIVPDLRRRASTTGQARMMAREALLAGKRATHTFLLGLSCAITQMGFYLIINWLPLLLVSNGYEASKAVFATSAFSLGNVVGVPSVGVLIDRFGTRRPLVAILVLLAGAMLGLAIAHGFLAIIATAFIAGFLAIAAQIGVYAIAPLYYPPEGRATGVGTIITLGRAGSVIGPLVTGFLMASGTSGSGILRIMALILPVAAAAIYFLPNKGSREFPAIKGEFA